MRLHALAVSIAALLPVLAVAQTASPAGGPAPALSPAELEDQQFEDAIRNFGFLSGAAYQCLSPGERLAHDREVLTAYSGLVRLFGSDRAFFYAAAFGAGTSTSLDRSKCSAYVDDFRAAMKSSRRGN